MNSCETCTHYDPFTETYGFCHECQKYMNRNDNCNEWEKREDGKRKSDTMG